MSLLSEADRAQAGDGAPADAPQAMLAVLTEDRFSDPGWIYERKLDGERALAVIRGGEVRLLSRNGKPLNDAYPELAEALADRAPPDCALDGEIVAFEGRLTSFARLQRRMQIRDPEAARASGVAVKLYLFDLIDLEGARLEPLPLRRRKALLRRAVDFADPLRFSAHRNGAGEAFFETACEKGWEGLIAKRADSAYVHGRSRDWLKFKCGHGQELVIGGFTAPQGARKGFGAILVGHYEDGRLRYAGKVGTGFDEETLERLRARFDDLAQETCPFAEDPGEDATWIAPELVAEIGFTEWTREGKLRHPRFKGLRRDKDPEDVVREAPQ